MTTLNVSIPNSMKAYVEAQAHDGDFTTSEYIRHLIRMDQERKTTEKRALIAQYLALCEDQLARDGGIEWNKDEFLAKAEKDYKLSKSKKNK